MDFTEILEEKNNKQLFTAFTPYRICPLGAHVDHQKGLITGFAIDKGIHIQYQLTDDGLIEVSSVQFDGVAVWNVNDIPERAVGDWADHLRGATRALLTRHELKRGVCAVVNGELPIGGLSSSAAVIITFISILAKVNGIKLAQEEMIELALEAENKYVGVSCGRLDQSCEVYCKKNNLLYLDLLSDSIELVPESENMPEYKIAIFFSGLERSLAQSKYNARVDEAKEAACLLLDMAGIAHGDQKSTYLTDVPREVFEEHKDKLPTDLKKRATHFFTECDRVRQGIVAWRNGDLKEFGHLVFESGKSSIEQWETGSPELIKLYEIMAETDGIYGGRFSGAGFKGCCMAIIDPKKQDRIVETVRERYISAFPHLAEKFSAHICGTADGVKIEV
ncbi:MAG: GHMP kinase [Clostridia bacterium]|nr:GHMP kinase [Clostridia bacterium]